jgi:hypothetical protein
MVWQIAISAVERLRLEGAPCRIPVALACPLARPALYPHRVRSVRHCRKSADAWRRDDCDLREQRIRLSNCTVSRRRTWTGFDDRNDSGDSWFSLLTSDVDSIFASKSDRAHRLFGQIIAQFQLGIFQEATEPTPKRQRVSAGFGQSALGQCAGAGRLDRLLSGLRLRRPWTLYLDSKPMDI